MKKSRLSYDAWECILSKKMVGKRVETEKFTGYVGLLETLEITEPQYWQFKKDTMVCDVGFRWLSLLSEEDGYCITAIFNENQKIVVWYIDMIAGQGVDADGVPYFEDLYLDLVVYPDGTIIVDDMDELEDALVQKDITRQQYQRALDTAEWLKKGMLSDISGFTEFTREYYEMIADELVEKL